MRRQSWALVMASNQNSGKGVLFIAESIGIVQIPDFRRAHHYKISKNLFQAVSTKILCLLELSWGPPNLLLVSVTQIILLMFTCQPSWGGVSVTRTILLMFTCRPCPECAAEKRFPTRPTRAFKTNQKKIDFQDFPPLFKPKLLCSNHFWLV